MTFKAGLVIEVEGLGGDVQGRVGDRVEGLERVPIDEGLGGEGRGPERMDGRQGDGWTA